MKWLTIVVPYRCHDLSHLPLTRVEDAKLDVRYSWMEEKLRYSDLDVSLVRAHASHRTRLGSFAPQIWNSQRSALPALSE